MSLHEAIGQYEDVHLAARNYAARTRREYLTDLRQLAQYLATAGVTTVQGVERVHVEGFLASLDRLALATSTRRRKLAAVRSFFRFLETVSHRTGDPAAAVTPPDLQRNQLRYLTQHEYERLRRAARHEPRDAAIIELILQTGLRLSEVANLQLADVELPGRKQGTDSSGSMRVWHGRRHRLVTLNAMVCAALRGYLLVRPADAQDDQVFQSKFRRGMGPRSIEDVVDKHLTAAGIRGASVHSLRHTFAVHSLKMGTDIDVLQKVLGHASPKSLTVYLDLARDELDRQLQEHAL
jgi:integrase/recombinase XerD